MNIWFIVVVGLGSGKDYLKAQTPTGYGSNGYCHSMEKLPMILVMIVGIFPTHPALEVRDVALQKRHKASLVNDLRYYRGTN
jgi:hypothetical protein